MKNNRFWKKLTAILLGLVMVLALCACGASDRDDDDDDDAHEGKGIVDLIREEEKSKDEDAAEVDSDPVKVLGDVQVYDDGKVSFRAPAEATIDAGNKDGKTYVTVWMPHNDALDALLREQHPDYEPTEVVPEIFILMQIETDALSSRQWFYDTETTDIAAIVAMCYQDYVDTGYKPGTETGQDTTTIAGYPAYRVWRSSERGIMATIGTEYYTEMPSGELVYISTTSYTDGVTEDVIQIILDSLTVAE